MESDRTESQAHYIMYHGDRLYYRRNMIRAFAIAEDQIDITVSDAELDNGKQDPNTVLFLDRASSGAVIGDIVQFISPTRRVIGYVHEANDIRILCDENEQPLDAETPIVVNSTGLIKQLVVEPMKTTVGRYMLNLLLLHLPIKKITIFIDDIWKPEKFSDILSKMLRDDIIDVPTTKSIIDIVYYLQSFVSLFAPSAGKKSFITDPMIAIRKQQLLEEHGDNLSDPLVAAKIEKELVALDKAFVGDAPERDYYDAMGGRTFDLHRRKMFLTVGGIEDFTEGSNTFTFIRNSLAEGWDPKDFDIIVNELRKGSYHRGVQTRLGGSRAKWMQQAFQNVRLTGDDCGTSRTVDVHLTTKNVARYNGRYVRLPGSSVFKYLSDDTISMFLGKTVKMRSPLYCEQKDGFCFKCAGKIFGDLQQRGVSMVETSIANTFQTQSMKLMHGTTIKTININLEDYLFEV